MLYYSDIVSSSSIHRHFYVNEGYYGCSGDLGWTLIVDGPGPCSMESLPTTAVYFVNTPSYSLMPGSKLSIGIYTTPTNLHHILIDKINFENILIINLITSSFWINILLTFIKLIILAMADFMAVFVEKGKFVKKKKRSSLVFQFICDLS